MNEINLPSIIHQQQDTVFKGNSNHMVTKNDIHYAVKDNIYIYKVYNLKGYLSKSVENLLVADNFLMA